jgi:hypothetical protein
VQIFQSLFFNHILNNIYIIVDWKHTKVE